MLKIAVILIVLALIAGAVWYVWEILNCADGGI